MSIAIFNDTRELRSIIRLRYFIILTIILAFIPSFRVFGTDRSFSVGINDSASYTVEKFQWNTNYTFVGNLSTSVGSSNSHIVLRGGYNFSLLVKSTGSSALVCSFDDDFQQITPSVDVICSTSFLGPYFSQLIYPVYQTEDQWSAYADALELTNPDIEIIFDAWYYQETQSSNVSNVNTNRFTKFNIQNGFLREYYYQYYEGNDFKNFREIRIIRLDQDTWISASQIVTTTPIGLFDATFFALFLLIYVRRCRNPT